MQSKNVVKARLIFTDDRMGISHLDVISTFNMTERSYLSRDPDMLVKDDKGLSWRIKKEYIAIVKELRVIGVEVEEVGSVTTSKPVVLPVDNSIDDDEEDDDFDVSGF